MPRSQLVALGRVRVCPADVGRRVSVRHRDPVDGRLTDAVGLLASWTGGALTIRRRDGTSVVAREDAVAAAKVVPPEVSAYEVQALAESGWPATDRERIGPWLLRWDHDVTRRANAALVDEPVEDLPAHLALVAAWYARRGSRAQLQIPQPWQGDAALDALGWTRVARTSVMTTPTATLARRAANAPPHRVTLTDAPDPAWFAHVDRFPEEQQRVLAAILTRAAVRTFATAYDKDGSVVGIGRASLDRHHGLAWCALTNLNTVPHARRTGVARAVTAALADWGLAHRASTAYLAVADDNEPARRLYASLGFEPHHRYAYRVAPESATQPGGAGARGDDEALSTP